MTLEKLRVAFKPKLPSLLEGPVTLISGESLRTHDGLETAFSHLLGQPILRFQKGEGRGSSPLKVGVVLSGGQAPGGHNVISGLFDALKKLKPENRLFGFLDGPKGIIENNSLEITGELLEPYRNQGGFDLLGSGRTKIETEEQLNAAFVTAKALDLDGIIIIGGDDSNTNAALLAQHFKAKGLKTVVNGVPKTIDGDLKNKFVEISFGFDTATKTYNEIIGNIMRDTLSAKKYWYFIKLMGRSASHIALESALQTRPNLCFIGEEVAEQQRTLLDLVREVADLVIGRSQVNKNYGVVLIPEGIIEFIPEIKKLIQELNQLLISDGKHAAKIASMRTKEEQSDYMLECLTKPSRQCFLSIPLDVRAQLLLDRDPHGNVQVSKIETERLFISMVKEELGRRKSRVSFNTQPLFLGYEGRSGFPSNFDCNYCYTLGHIAALLVANRATGYITSVQNLTGPVEDWEIGGIPLLSMIHLEERNGKMKPVIQKALVDLEGPVFGAFAKKRPHWLLEDAYRFPGPIQFFGPAEIQDAITLTLGLEREEDEVWHF